MKRQIWVAGFLSVLITSLTFQFDAHAGETITNFNATKPISFDADIAPTVRTALKARLSQLGSLNGFRIDTRNSEGAVGPNLNSAQDAIDGYVSTGRCALDAIAALKGTNAEAINSDFIAKKPLGQNYKQLICGVLSDGECANWLGTAARTARGIDGLVVSYWWSTPSESAMIDSSVLVVSVNTGGLAPSCERLKKDIYIAIYKKSQAGKSMASYK